MKFWVLAPIALAAAGCNNMNSTQLSDLMTKKLGTPVFLWAYDTDACVKKQLNGLYDEYRHLHLGDRKAFVQKVQKAYDAIIIQATASLDPAQGVVREIELLKHNCTGEGPQQNCKDEKVESRIFSDERTTPQGRLPGVQVEKGKELTLLPATGKNASTKIVYTTFSYDLYQSLSVTTMDALNSALQSGDVVEDQQFPDSGNDVCGPQVSLSDLF
jgi:hypothetical protein